jgi:hypothetical protein
MPLPVISGTLAAKLLGGARTGDPEMGAEVPEEEVTEAEATHRSRYEESPPNKRMQLTDASVLSNGR